MHWFVTLLILCAFPASAETLYRCKSRDGEVSLQSDPCPAGAEQTARDFVVRYDPDAAARRQAIDAEMERRSVAQRRSIRYTSAGRKRSGDGCAAAKTRRQRTLDSVGMRRNFDLLRRLDEQVHSACK